MAYDKYFRISNFYVRRCWIFFLIKLQFSILKFYWKKIPQYRCFLKTFVRYLRHFQATASVPTERYFTNKIVKGPWKINWKQLVRKTKTCVEKKHEVFISLYYSKISLFLFPANICWSSRRLEDVFKTCLQDVFSTYSA